MFLFPKMASTQKVVLLACGSFNPPTNMHLRMFELGRDYLQRTGKFNVIAGIMSPVSDGYKKKDLAPAKHRCAMVQLAIKSSKWVRLDTWESEQPSWLETEKVLVHHKTALQNQANITVKATPSKKRRKDRKNEDVLDRGCDNSSPRHTNKEEHEQVQLKLLCGGDLLESFAVPGLWADDDIEAIVSNYGLVCVTRNGSDPRKFIYESDILTKYQDNIHIVTEWIQNEISSTKIRRALRRKESVKYLLQDSVIDYIREHQLYGVTCNNKYIEKATRSPQNEAMDFVDGDMPNEILIINTVPRSPLKVNTKLEIREIERPRSPRLVDFGYPRSPKTGSIQGSPRRFMDDEADGDSSNSPKSPQPGPCISDLGTIVRRVRNVRVGFTPETRVFAYTATETCV